MFADQDPRRARGPRIGSGRSSDVFEYGPDQVLKLYRVPWEPAAILNEFDATQLAWARGLPVPVPVRITQEDGRTGIVFARLQGRSVLRRYARDPVGLLLALRQIARLQRQIHACDAAQLPSQHAMLRSQIAKARVSDPVKRAALAVLDRLPDGTSLCHGDLHPENVICTPDGLSIVDWQKARAGNPAADVARTALILEHGRWNLGRLGSILPTTPIRKLVALLYLWRYAQLTGTPVSELRAWRLPLLVSRLFGQAAANEDAVRADAEYLARRVREPGPGLVRTTVLMACVAVGLSDEAMVAALFLA